MTKILESVPNYSVGKDEEVIEKIVGPFKGHEDVKLLDYSADPDHNRLVVTNVGSPEGLFEATLETVGIAVDLIDMTEHTGEHPRMGAVDVIPFTPVRNVTMDEAVELAKRLANAAAEEYDLPIYLYEEAATRPERKNLATIRKGEFEGFPEKIKDQDWKPDFGPDKVHPIAGVTAIGARKPLVAFNVNLNTDDPSVAKQIAREVRGSSGGLHFCKAMGVDLEEEGLVQVSMNMTDYTRTSLQQAFELIRSESGRFGVTIAESEIVGLVPADALLDAAEHYLQLEDFSSDQVIENRLLEDL
ncbi:MAG: glutamate formimidoyltransferase [Candidatus Bipolaricaulota bacterium]|nr:glutamate formimidoyltransferase [Candidatus Bipolaricaulota bacterium]MBS3791088.1 glutamate formimidoyltransferase [Candidatus Bipolaricaulota bacterium]